MLVNQKRSGDPNPQYFPKVLRYKWGAYCRTNGRRTAVQMGGVLWGFPFFEAQKPGKHGDEMGGVLPYKLEVYCRTFQTSFTCLLACQGAEKRESLKVFPECSRQCSQKSGCSRESSRGSSHCTEQQEEHPREHSREHPDF